MLKAEQGKTCVFDKMLEDYLLGKLPEEAQKKTSLHLMNCRACRRKLNEIRKLKFHLSSSVQTHKEQNDFDEKKVATCSRNKYILLAVFIILLPVFAFVFFSFMPANMRMTSVLIKRAEAGKTEDNLRIVYRAILQWVTKPADKDAPLFPENLEELVREHLIKTEMLYDPVSGSPIEYFPIVSEDDFQQNTPLLRSKVGDRYCTMYAKGNVVWEDMKATK
jgi:hypothetical protein